MPSGEFGPLNEGKIKQTSFSYMRFNSSLSSATAAASFVHKQVMASSSGVFLIIQNREKGASGAMLRLDPRQETGVLVGRTGRGTRSFLQKEFFLR